jgi:hypothetical protein
MDKEKKSGGSLLTRKWHIETELSNGQKSYYSVVMADLAPYIKRKRLELDEKGDSRALTPLAPWVFEYVMDKFEDEELNIYSMNPPTICIMKISSAKNSGST